MLHSTSFYSHWPARSIRVLSVDVEWWPIWWLLFYRSKSSYSCKWNHLQRDWFIYVILQILESLIFPAVIKPDPQHGVYGVLERYKLEGNFNLDVVLNLGLNSIVLLTQIVFLSQGAAVIFPLKEAECYNPLDERPLKWQLDCEGWVILLKSKCAMP